jgi:hypothetical protein
VERVRDVAGVALVLLAHVDPLGALAEQLGHARGGEILGASVHMRARLLALG